MGISCRKVLPLAVLAGLLGAAPVRADWTSYGGNPEHQIYTNEKLTAPLGVLWKYVTTTYAGRDGNHAGAVVQNGTLYFASKNTLYAVDTVSGEKKWQVPEADSSDPNLPLITATPAVSGEFVYAPMSDGTMVAYQTVDGSQLWAFKTGATVRSAPMVVGDALYFGSDDDFVYCIDARTGELRWKSNERGKDLKLSDDAVGSPVFYNNVIYINSSDMKLWAFQADTGRLIWQQRMNGPSVDISPVALNNRIYMAAGNSIYQFRLRGGNYRTFPLQQWVEGDISTTPIITEDFWFFGDRSGHFHAFDSTGHPAKNPDGKPWKIKLEGKPQGAPVMTADTIYVTTDKGFVYGIDIEKGQITWTYRSEAPKGIEPLYSYYAIRAPLAVDNGHLYVVGDDGTLTCMSTEATDDEGPALSQPRPSRDTVTNGSPPLYFSVYIWDEGTGINPDTIEVMLDGVPIEQSPVPYNDRVSGERKGWLYDPVRRQIRYQTLKGVSGKTEQPLLDGRHKVQVQAADWRGNFASLEWSFVVDNKIPKGASAIKPTAGRRVGFSGTGAAGGAPGGFPGDAGGGYPGMGAPGGGPGGAGGMMGGPGGMGGQQGGAFRGRFGGYQYNNRGRGGYGGFGGQQGGGLGRPGY